MLRLSFSLTAIAVCLLLTQGPSAAQNVPQDNIAQNNVAQNNPAQNTVQDHATPAHKTALHKKHVTRHWHGYGFLPGYRPPEVIERQRAERAWRNGWAFYGPAWPGFYRGRWNGGGFGPCYTQTPIGPMWNCGR